MGTSIYNPLFIHIGQSLPSAPLPSHSYPKATMPAEQMLNPERYPTDTKLLLCQLAYDAKEGNTWEDILDRFINHPIITRLHRTSSMDFANIKADDLSTLVLGIINDTVSKLDAADASGTTVKRPRGRRPQRSSHDEKLIEESAVGLEYFQPSNQQGRELLLSCCGKLHKLCVAEIKRKLSNNRKEFNQLLSQLT